jgi:hypothetical protein
LVEDREHSGCPPKVAQTKIWREYAKSSTKTNKVPFRRFAGILGLSYGTCQQILMEDLNMERISTKFVPWLLTDKQKQQPTYVCQELLDEVTNNQNVPLEGQNGRQNLALLL